MSKEDYLSYEQSGVSIDANDQMVERISRSVASTHGPRVINMHNAFAGLFRLDYDEKLFKRNYRNPVLVACTDGVGTKVIIAQQMGRYDGVGIDLVAMSVNDMIVQGAEPLFFLDYLAVNHLDPEQVAQMVESVATGCRWADCALIGGETAEMPDLYGKDEYDMAGFSVGVVEKDRIITGSGVQKGDVILGLGSSGIHSNGYSLVRTICFKKHKLKVTDCIDELDGRCLGDVLLVPTRIYVKPIVKLLRGYKVKQVVHAMAHITGGGLVGNIPRVLPDNCNAVLKTKSWPVPDIFNYLQKQGPVADAEMFRVFNMGIGYILVVAPDFADSIQSKLTRYGEQVYRIGTITTGSGTVILK
ncbi:MAG: phosphoribosylformylglycinamidine cyclo-ligase [Planctomycetales bacterium 4572_13]|nr:MAG: phosphoribosylformylglycinamidine cyclo-ligase [Planctomycetales bacterium 4572_13]